MPKQTGSSVAHCPNQTQVWFAARRWKVSSEWVAVGLGSDSVASNTCDILEEARFATCWVAANSATRLPKVFAGG